MPEEVLFVTWDGPQTNYLEGLFMPIFFEISRKRDVTFHIIQFSWADQSEHNQLKQLAQKYGFVYIHYPVLRKPSISMGAMLTIAGAKKKIAKYLVQNNIDIVMPRSTFPAMMLSSLRNDNLKIIYDADGLPIEERVDFFGMKKNSFQYRFLTSVENKMIAKADAVVTRSRKASEIHIARIGRELRSKLFVVNNGRDTSLFRRSELDRTSARNELEIEDDETLFVYAGSLGSQYCLAEMLNIFGRYLKQYKARFLILTGDTEYLEATIPEALRSFVIYRTVNYEKVPYFLNAGDLAFALRKPTFSMQGIAPIKLGEYLLCGLPVIASKGIGDTEDYIKFFEECYLFDHTLPLEFQYENIVNFINRAKECDKFEIASKAIPLFSLEAAAESYIKAFDSIGI
ncbi:hypothetical protein LL912_14230 [Niabella sp. CC-SYL272]|uniref:glycosyltransferase n=1 Tax=Niabella agricola TaxID=2891571 RepID=UPI001F159E45|nr:hypothetical protein [Niabella agricola]MCF3109935.1 hypothetical protein [Niabella agricola]